MKNPDAIAHVAGRSVFLDDIPEIKGVLHAQVVGAPVAHGRIRRIDREAATALPGVVGIFSHADIPGQNQIGGILPDEPLLAEETVHYRGQPVLLVIARDEYTARQAARLVRMDCEEWPALTDVEEAWKKGAFLFPPRTFRLGDTAAAWASCAHVLEGVAETGAQEHVYLETQAAYACPVENGGLQVYSSTQAPTLVQKIIARILGLPMHQVQVETGRLGGGFGGKEDQATAWACLAALAAWRLGQPVKLVLSRHDDMRMTGKRHPYRSFYKIGLSESLQILAYEVTFLQNGGASADLSPAIMERTLFHATHTYFIPHVKATAFSCRTNLPPFTAFRGFGAPQALFVMESAISHAAGKLGVPAHRIQSRNLLREGDETPYGQRVRQARARACWRKARREYDFAGRERAVRAFNKTHAFQKKGLAMMPICFGISFTNTQMNQAGALVHIYQDGSVGLSTGAVEMGQGVNAKLVQVAARSLGIAPERIRVEPTHTKTVANTSPTAASSGADLNGKAVEDACAQLNARLQEVAAQAGLADPGWEQLVAEAFRRRVHLSAKGHYATPVIHFDKSVEKGHPFAYYVFGTAIVTATVDCLRGVYEIDEVQIVHDFGESLLPDIDRGQLEGGVVQGIGWMTSEEVAYNSEGRLLSDTLSNYKPPDLHAAPGRIDFQSLGAPGPRLGILRSKAIGEPPFLYGIGAYFAIQEAMKAFRPEMELTFSAPLTPEKVLLALYPDRE
jgi:xanthine dehydrogenase large subunit